MIDPQVLFSEAACLNCYSNASTADLLKLALLQRVAEGMSINDTILTAEVWAAAGVPVHTPSIGRQVYLNTNDGTQYNYYSGAWH